MAAKKRAQLPRKAHEAIKRLCAEGDRLANIGELQSAYEKYDEAWGFIPEPKIDWEASTWVLASIGDIQFRNKSFSKALNTFLRAVQCPNGLGNPFIHLRIGQCQFELGNMHGAGDNLARAYMSEGDSIFRSENPKYFSYLQSILLPPSG